MIRIDSTDSLRKWLVAKTSGKLILVFFLVMLAIHVACTFSGFYNDDDVNYARHAAAVAEHGINITPATDHFQLRWSTVYSAAIFFKLFGINSITAALGSLLSFFLCGVLLYRNSKGIENGMFLLILTLFFFSRTVLLNMHRLLPDAIMCLAILWMYFSYYRAKHASVRFFAFSFAAGFFLALITKETIIIALPLFAVLCLRDLLNMNRLSFWKYAVLFSLLFMVPYLLYFQYTTGNLFYRFEILTGDGYFNPCSFERMPFVFTLNRISYELWWNQLMDGDMMLIIPAIAAVLYRKKIDKPGSGRSDYLAFTILLLSANFMSISWKAYVPLCPASRHFIFILPFAAMIGANMLNAYFLKPLKYPLLPLLFLLATVVTFFNPGSIKFAYLFIFLLLAIVPLLVGKNHAGINKVFSTICIIAVFLLNYLAAFAHPLFPYYFDQKKIVDTNFRNKNSAATIISADPFTSELNDYFMNFHTGKLKFLTITDPATIRDSTVYFLVNAQRTPGWYNKADSMVKNTIDSITLLNQVNDIYLYKIAPLCMRRLRGW